MIRVSKKLIAAIKLADQPAYKIAQKAGIESSTLSKLLHGNGKVWPHDRRILAVAKVLGLAPEDCFMRDTKTKPNPSLMTGEG